MQGCAYAVVKLKFDKTVYKNGRPNITFDIKGKPLYDHRVGITQWSNNAALATIDFMRSVDGLNATDDEIDWASVDAAADVCDQVPEQMAASLCDGRYIIDGQFLRVKSRKTICAAIRRYNHAHPPTKVSTV